MTGDQQQQQPEQHESEPSQFMNFIDAQTHAEPDLFSISELDFDLPPLDSPDQTAMLDVHPSTDHGQTHVVPKLLHTASGDAQQLYEHELDSQARAQLGGAMEQSSLANACDDSSLAEAHQAYGGGSMMALLSSQAVRNNCLLLHCALLKAGCNLAANLVKDRMLLSRCNSIHM